MLCGKGRLMSLKIIEGAIAGIGDMTPVSSADPTTGEARPTGAHYALLRLQRSRGRTETINRVLADAAMGACIVAGAAGRFAFYTHRETFVLCGFSDGDRTLIASAAQDPAGIAADARRTLAKRKIFFGVVMIPTIILISFGIDKLKEGRRMLKENPRPRRPSEAKIRRRLER
jgi:hypothetical protein